MDNSSSRPVTAVLAAADVFHDEFQGADKGGEVCSIDQAAALASLGNDALQGHVLQMKGQSGRLDAQLIGYGAGREPGAASLDIFAEDLQDFIARWLRNRAQNSGNICYIHILIIAKIMDIASVRRAAS